jgi:2-polyprenyl-3-methyl-5-hydroxy-6-metoxy-1,4-benzoquinol methylase
MLPEQPDFRHRAHLAELMDEPASRDELRACLRDLARVNRWTLGYRPLLHWLKSMVPARNSHPVHIVDIGCGYGDSLRRIESWASNRRARVELTGLDASRDTIEIAAEAAPRSSNIHWVASDVFAWKPQRPIHIVISSLFTHHLSDADVIRFVQWMELHAALGWFINDLSRHPTPYRLFRVFSKLMGFHPYVQHDGPVSIARSFVPEDWSRICSAAGLGQRDVTIRGYTPGRLCVGRRKTT